MSLPINLYLSYGINFLIFKLIKNSMRRNFIKLHCNFYFGDYANNNCVKYSLSEIEGVWLIKEKENKSDSLIGYVNRR